jgi:hypothetical protein
VVAALLLSLAWFGVPIVVPGAIAFGVLGGLLAAVAVAVWWLFFSRAPRSERWGAVVLMIVALFATSRVVHESIATGMMGMMFFLYAIPVLSLGFVAWAVASRRLANGPRRATMVATILLACGVWTLLRSDGITGDGAAQFAWRWARTPEERLLARADDKHPFLADTLRRMRADGIRRAAVFATSAYGSYSACRQHLTGHNAQMRSQMSIAPQIPWSLRPESKDNTRGDAGVK